jgi:hypothetical protein
MNDVYTAITETGPDGNFIHFDVTKKLIAEYMTLRQQERFYGGKEKFDIMKNLNPGDFESWDEYIKNGGNKGYAQKVLGWDWQEPILYTEGSKRGEVKYPGKFVRNKTIGFQEKINLNN